MTNKSETPPHDERMMLHALALAHKGLYTTTPNPRVGCVITRGNQIIGEGWHHRAGEPHAEIEALKQATAQSNTQGACVYVTLEPCAHHGRTGPCVDALIAAQVSRVVIATLDPNPQVAGRGVERLRAHGIAVEVGLCQQAAYELNLGFMSRMQRQRPWVRMKIAASLDGRTALANGRSQWITSPEARQDGHRWRAQACAILTGLGTIIHDDPRLTVREIETTRQPIRIIIDRQLNMPHQAQVLAPEAPTWLICAHPDTQRLALWQTKNVRIIPCPDDQDRIDFVQLMKIFADHGINELHVEAGAKLNAALLRAGCVDELLIYLAPQLIGGDGLGMFDHLEFNDLKQTINLSWRDIHPIGPDVRLIARVHAVHD